LLFKRTVKNSAAGGKHFRWKIKMNDENDYINLSRQMGWARYNWVTTSKCTFYWYYLRIFSMRRSPQENYNGCGKYKHNFWCTKLFIIVKSEPLIYDLTIQNKWTTLAEIFQLLKWCEFIEKQLFTFFSEKNYSDSA
jgi:hypothetical protein